MFLIVGSYSCFALVVFLLIFCVFIFAYNSNIVVLISRDVWCCSTYSLRSYLCCLQQDINCVLLLWFLLWLIVPKAFALHLVWVRLPLHLAVLLVVACLSYCLIVLCCTIFVLGIFVWVVVPLWCYRPLCWWLPSIFSHFGPFLAP
jgi:hypothetical protein